MPAYLPEQDLLLPPSLHDWSPENHLAHFVSDVVDQLDLSAIESVYEKEERGQPPYQAAHCVGVFSSRQMEKKWMEDVGFRMLAAGNEPDFRTISDFRKLISRPLAHRYFRVCSHQPHCRIIREGEIRGRTGCYFIHALVLGCGSIPRQTIISENKI
jgi:transposase